jgi:hypothetical protein
MVKNSFFFKRFSSVGKLSSQQQLQLLTDRQQECRCHLAHPRRPKSSSGDHIGPIRFNKSEQALKKIKENKFMNNGTCISFYILQASRQTARVDTQTGPKAGNQSEQGVSCTVSQPEQRTVSNASQSKEERCRTAKSK